MSARPAGSRGAGIQERRAAILAASPEYPLTVRRTVAIALFALASIALFVYSLNSGGKTEWSEALGFITGALCVWMTVHENVWNFPVGIANSVFSMILFYNKALYADFGLSVLYIVLGVQGWTLWRYGGRRDRELRASEVEVNPPIQQPESETLVVTRATRSDLVTSVLIVLIGLPLLNLYLTKLNGSAPFMDALLTSMSVAAQLLLNCKRLENWLVWIVADVLYVGLFAAKGLYLYALLYAVFCGLAVSGYRTWRKSLVRSGAMIG